jgi:hypothetical protein
VVGHRATDREATVGAKREGHRNLAGRLSVEGYESNHKARHKEMVILIGRHGSFEGARRLALLYVRFETEAR